VDGIDRPALSLTGNRAGGQGTDIPSNAEYRTRSPHRRVKETQGADLTASSGFG